MPRSPPPESQSALNASPTLPRYTLRMRYVVLPLLLVLATPALADEPPHTGVAGSRSMPELSDILLAACAAGGIWFVRSRMRAKFRKAPKD